AIGWIGHQSHLYEHLTVRENLLFWAALYGVPAARRGPRADQVLERLGMGDRADQPVWSLSRGLAQRAAIAKAVIHDPRVLLLEFRTRTALVSAIVFTALVLTVFNFGRDPTAVPTIDLAPTILWVTFTFAAMLALNRAFQLELENQALEGLLVSPLSRTSLYWGKLIANLVFVGVVEAVGLPLFVLFFDVPVGQVLVPLACLAAVYVRALAFTPVERLQGPAQKIFYLHVPAALWTEAAMVLVGLAGIFYLFLKDPRLDRFAEASAEVGTVFATVVLT